MGWCDDINYPKKYNQLIKLIIKLNMKNLKEKIINMIY